MCRWVNQMLVWHPNSSGFGRTVGGFSNTSKCRLRKSPRHNNSPFRPTRREILTAVQRGVFVRCFWGPSPRNAAGNRIQCARICTRMGGKFAYGICCPLMRIKARPQSRKTSLKHFISRFTSRAWLMGKNHFYGLSKKKCRCGEMADATDLKSVGL